MYTLSNENFAAPLAYSECALRQCVLNEPPTSLQRAIDSSSVYQLVITANLCVYKVRVHGVCIGLSRSVTRVLLG